MIRYTVEKMGCGGCARTVTRAVQAVAPDAHVAVDLGAKVVTVSGGGPVERIAQAITAAGFPAAPILPAPIPSAA